MSYLHFGSSDHHHHHHHQHHPRYHVSYSRPRSVHICSPSSVYISSPFTESDDEYARRRDRKYALNADELKNLKTQKEKVKEWLGTARSWEDVKAWQPKYEELKARVKWMEKRVDEERKEVLRRYRL